MDKNERGFGAAGYFLVLFVTLIIAAASWNVYRHQKNSPPKSTNTQQAPVKDNPVGEITSDKSLIVDPNQDNRARIYPKPTAPAGLKATPSGSGYNLTWEASIAVGNITKYQVYYQGNLIAEPTTTTYQHNLPPPPPGCQPITLNYFVRAVDNDESLSPSSNSVTVQFGGC